MISQLSGGTIKPDFLSSVWAFLSLAKIHLGASGHLTVRLILSRIEYCSSRAIFKSAISGIVPFSLQTYPFFSLAIFTVLGLRRLHHGYRICAKALAPWVQNLRQ